MDILWILVDCALAVLSVCGFMVAVGIFAPRKKPEEIPDDYFEDDVF